MNVFEHYQKEAAYIHLTIEMLEGNGTVDLVSKLDGNVQNEDSNYDEHFWNEIDRGTIEEIGYLTTKTIPNNFGIEQFTVTAAMRHFVNGKAVVPDYHEDTLALHGCLSAELSQGETWTVEKEIIVLTSRDIPEAQQAEKALSELANQTNNYIQAKRRTNSGLGRTMEAFRCGHRRRRRSTARYSLQFVPTILYLLRRR